MNTTIFKDYVIIDELLDDPYNVIAESLSINYYSNESVSFDSFNLSMMDKPEGSWRGYRSEQLDKIKPELFSDLNNRIIKSALGTNGFQYNVSSFFHRGDESIDCQNLWHKDTNVLFAYVLYLNPNPIPNSGTLIKVGNEIHPIENKFNRLVVYNSALEHRVERFFGNTFETSRLTLTGFIHGFCVSN